MQSCLKLGVCGLLCLSITAGVSGCANIQNDATRTKTEGALVGAGVGGGVGALVGTAIGGNATGALIGGGIGAILGSLTGLAAGNYVADKKAEYASREEWLDACIEEARKSNQAAVEYNAKLSKEIKELDKRCTKLAADFKRQQAKRETLLAEKATIDKQQKAVEAGIKSLEERSAKQKAVAQDARSGKNTTEADIMDAEVKKLETQIAELKKHNQKLASISVRMAV